MLRDTLQQVVEASRGTTKPLYLRNLLKEELQNYLLNFVYNSREYRDLIFTGGTCLRKIYGLPRLSEDLDFDYTDTFDIEVFAEEVKHHFTSVWQYKEITTKISGPRNTVFIKLPILKGLGLTARDEVLFVRCDFSQETAGEFRLETSSLSTADFTFFVRHYDLTTLFANKIAAFLTRDFFRGSEQTIPFKARDVFDLVWFLEKSKKSDSTFEPHWPRLLKLLAGKSRQEIVHEVIKKIDTIEEQEIKNDLNPFIESTQSVEAFSRSFKEIVRKGFTAYGR